MPGKVDNYNGPLYKKEIVSLIRKEAADEGIVLPDSIIIDIIGHFFKCLVAKMDKNIIHIERLGDFGPTKERTLQLGKNDYMRDVRARASFRRRQLKQMNKLNKIKQEERKKNKMTNKKLIKRGQKTG